MVAALGLGIGCGWFAATRARSLEHLGWSAVLAFVAGVALAIAATFLPVERIAPGVKTADGRLFGGAVVRVEAAPGATRYVVLRGNGDLRRGDVLEARR